MALDGVNNFAKVEVSTGYDAAATSIVLATGDGAKLPDPATANYNVVWWNFTDYPDPADDPNKEIVRVTAKTTDTLTVTRNQESSGASTKNTATKTYKMILGITAKMITDIEGQLGGGNKTLWIPATSGFSESTSGQGVIGDIPVCIFDDNSASRCYISWSTPDDFTSITSFKLYWSTTTISANAYMGLESRALGEDESVTAGGSTDSLGMTTYASSSTANGVNIEDWTAGVNGLTISANDVMGFQIKRFGADVSDTINAAVNILGVQIVYS